MSSEEVSQKMLISWESILARISHEEHQTEWKTNTILIDYTLIYLKFGIADCNGVK